MKLASKSIQLHLRTLFIFVCSLTCGLTLHTPPQDLGDLITISQPSINSWWMWLLSGVLSHCVLHGWEGGLIVFLEDYYSPRTFQWRTWVNASRTRWSYLASPMVDRGAIMWKCTKSSVQFSGQWQEFRFEDLLQEPWSEPLNISTSWKLEERGGKEKREKEEEKEVWGQV